MEQVIKDIINIKRKQSYVDYLNYHKDNIFNIVRTSRLELPHSNFIAWMLRPTGLNLGFYPVRQLLYSLCIAKDRPENEKSQWDEILMLKFFDEDFITDVTVEREANKIDILLEITTSESKKLPIIIENKVKSHENGKNKDQTIDYYNKSEKKYNDRKKYYSPIYVYLHPSFNYEMQKEEKFIRISYQDLVDYVIEPCLYNTQDTNKQQNIKSYLQSLSYQIDNNKKGEIMAMSDEERRIIERFVEENVDLLTNVIESLDVSEDAKKNVIASVRDRSKYEFENTVYGKGRLVLAVVKKLVEDLKSSNPNLTIADLEKAMNPSLLNNFGIYKDKNKITNPNYLGINDRPRYFIDEPIFLPDGTEVLVCTEWGKDNIDIILDWAKNYGYKITKK